jgi:hypothetical protein
MIASELDGNYIDAEPLKDRTKGELVRGYKAIFTRWKQTGTISLNGTSSITKHQKNSSPPYARTAAD